jgi:hypothetical protein
MDETGRHMWIPEQVEIGERCRLCRVLRGVIGRADPPEAARPCPETWPPPDAPPCALYGRSWGALTAKLRKSAVAPSFAFGCGSEFANGGGAYLAIAPPCKCVRPLPRIRDGLAARPVKNDVSGISQVADVEYVSVWMRCGPSQIAFVVFTEPDQYLLPVKLE